MEQWAKMKRDRGRRLVLEGVRHLTKQPGSGPERTVGSDLLRYDVSCRLTSCQSVIRGLEQTADREPKPHAEHDRRGDYSNPIRSISRYNAKTPTPLSNQSSQVNLDVPMFEI